MSIDLTEFELTESHQVDHVMKSWPAFFSEIALGNKKHDIRDKNEREFKVGQICRLCEYDPFPKTNGEESGYSGDYVDVRITYITSNDTPCAFSSAVLAKNACVLSFELL